MNEVNIEKLYNLIKNLDNFGTLDSFKTKMSTTEQRRRFFDKFYSDLKSKGVSLGKYAEFESRYGSLPTQNVTVNPVLQKLMSIDEFLRKTTSPDQVIYRFGNNSEMTEIFWADGNWRRRINGVNNKNDEHIGKWSFVGDDNYKIVDETDNSIYDSKTDTWSQLTKTGSTWNNITFTLNDVATGKAVLKRGDKGSAVTELQKLMISLNLSKVSDSGNPDGYFGKLTELSIKQFQGDNMSKGEMDGKVGQRTLKRMFELRDYNPDKEVNNIQTPKTTTDYRPKDIPSDTLNPQSPPEELQENIKKIVSKNLKSLLK